MLEVLVVDDDDIVRSSIASALTAVGHEVVQASNGEDALSLLASRPFDLVVSDVRMPRLDGLSLFRRVRRDAPGTAVVLMTSFAKIPDIVGSLRDGALDFVTKPFDPDEFADSVVGPLDERRAHRKRFEAARAELVGRQAGGRLVGTSLAMRRLAERVSIVAKSDAPVIIVGEPGTGKKLVARTIHAESPRRDGPFLVVPCASLFELMVESELRDLSEMRGRSYRDEWFRAAAGGTLVLDGIDQLPPSAQSSLLRVLDEPSAQARRSREWQPVGVRVVSLTHVSPSRLIEERGFQQALFFRLNATEVHVPALRAREGDLYMLVCHFLRELTPPGRTAPSLTPQAWKALSEHSFRGNVREVAWAVEHALVAANGKDIDLGDLPEEISQGGAGEREPEGGATPERRSNTDRPAVRLA
jgi:DNA-binding NtrC family response regulator